MVIKVVIMWTRGSDDIGYWMDSVKIRENEGKGKKV